MPERPFETVATRSPASYQDDIRDLPRLLDVSDFDLIPAYSPPGAGRNILARLLALLSRR